MSKTIFDRSPLLVIPDIACKFGLNEAIILQQIHYWIEVCKEKKINEHDGFTWTYNSYTDWEKQFPFMSKRTIQRSIKLLEDSSVLVYRNYNKLKIDRTKWYTINYKALEIALETEWFQPSGQIGTTMMTKWHNHMVKLALPLPKNYTKNLSLELRATAKYFQTSTVAYSNAFLCYFGYPCRKINSEPVFEMTFNSYEEYYQMFTDYFEAYGKNNKQHNLEHCSIENIEVSSRRYDLNNYEW